MNIWWHLWYEFGDTIRQKPGFEHRHDLSFAGDGFALPRLTIVPSSERLQLMATRWAPRHAPIEFVEDAEAFVSRAELETEFRTIVEAVLERLRNIHDEGSASDSLGDAWNAINSLDPEEVEFSAAAALLGTDPFDVDPRLADSVAAFSQRAAPSIRKEALASCDESNLSRVGEWLDDAVAALERTGKRNGWAEVRETVKPVQAAEPWQRGYELANSVRRHLGICDGRFDFRPDGPLAVHHSMAAVPCKRIHGLVAAGAPACITAERNEAGKRFLLARALGDFIGRSEQGPGILTSLYTDRQAQSRAFAAELLAPAESLRARLGDEPVEGDMIDEFGREFGVSSQVILHQMENHGLARLGTYGLSLR